MVRRVGTDRVSVWVATSVGANVTLSIYAHAAGVAGGATTPLGQAAMQTKQIGASLFVALPTVTFAAGSRLLPGTIYDYDLSFDGVNLGALGLLTDTTIKGHRHLALGYAPNFLPTFVTPPADATALVIAHGSCRRPYADGQDGLVALDQIIDRGREGPPAGPRPHYLFMTGDQIYADDLSDEMLAWANDASLDLVGKTPAGNAIEHLRVELPDPAFVRVARFPADRTHFPPGRRARLGTRAAGLTSDDTQNHALSFGEICAHYLMSWSNVLWPKLDDAATWAALYKDRGTIVRDYLGAWQKSNAAARSAVQQRRSAQPGYSVPGKADLDTRVRYIDGWRLLPPANRGIDHFAVAAIPDWNGAATPEWLDVWKGATAPEPAAPADVAATSNVDPSKFIGSPDDLRDLANLMTPAWYAGARHFEVAFDYKVVDTNAPPSSLDDLELMSDAVLDRLQTLKEFYEGLPFVRRALANVSSLMMFDDHEVTDDWTITKEWVTQVYGRTLGRDLISNALAAYILFQDWGNDHTKYEGTTPNAQAMDLVCSMFVDAGQVRADGPPDTTDSDVRQQLEQLFGLSGSKPLPEQASWSFAITDPDTAPYEIVLLDNRTRRGYDDDTAPPANLSIEAISTQIQASGPAGSAVSIVIAPLPVVGYPPTEELLQPLMNLWQGIRETRRTRELRHQRETFPEIVSDYEFGRLIKDPEAWAFNSRAQEALFARLSSRPAVVLLSGDIHFAITGNVTYFTATPQGLVAKSRFAQLVSSALKNVPPAAQVAYAQLGIAEQIGAVIGGPYDRLGWAGAGDAPTFDTTGASFQLASKMLDTPAVIPVRMLPPNALAQLRSRTLAKPPEWAWRFDLVKDVRPDSERYAAFSGAAPLINLPSAADVASSPTGAAQQIANHHVWNTGNGMSRRMFMFSNLGLVQFERTVPADETSPLVVVHSLYAWDRTDLGPTGGARDYNVPWPDGRLPAQPYTTYRISFALGDELAPDRPDPTEVS